VKSEDALALSSDLRIAPSATAPYFAEIASFGRARAPSPIIEIGRIVEVKGDTKRGKNYFPHPFPARMPIEVAQAAVSALSRPGDMVLDPMVGSGIVAKAALGLGRQAMGFDTDPLAIVQSRAEPQSSIDLLYPGGRRSADRSTWCL
jgi:DNA modification methylase